MSVPTRGPIRTMTVVLVMLMHTGCLYAQVRDGTDEQIVYGRACYEDGVPPAGRERVEALVAKGDKAGLLEWLRSPSPEKQIYAVEGLFRLKESGVTLSEQELAMVRSVAEKEGAVRVCEGCSVFTEDIREVAKKFKF